MNASQIVGERLTGKPDRVGDTMCRKVLSRLESGNIPPRNVKYIEHHLSVCESCRMKYADMKKERG